MTASNGGGVRCDPTSRSLRRSDSSTESSTLYVSARFSHLLLCSSNKFFLVIGINR